MDVPTWWRIQLLHAEPKRLAERGTAGAGRIQAEDLHIQVIRRHQFARRLSAAQSERPGHVERQLPDKSHNSCNHEVFHLIALSLTSVHQLIHGCATSMSDDGRNTLGASLQRPQTRNTIHPQRNAATGHPKEAKAATKSAAMSIFECNAEACSLWAIEVRKRNSEPDQ